MRHFLALALAKVLLALGVLPATFERVLKALAGGTALGGAAGARIIRPEAPPPDAVLLVVRRLPNDSAVVSAVPVRRT